MLSLITHDLLQLQNLLLCENFHVIILNLRSVLLCMVLDPFHNCYATVQCTLTKPGGGGGGGVLVILSLKVGCV